MSQGVVACTPSTLAPPPWAPARSTILPPSSRAGEAGPRGRVVCTVEEYLVALLGAGRGTDIQDTNVIGENVPTFTDELRFTLPAEAG